MRADRAAAGLSGAAILVVIALSPGGIFVMEPILLTIAGLVVLATFAPILPLLHRLPRIGAPTVKLRVTIGDQKELVVPDPSTAVMLRIGVFNGGRGELERARLNVLVPVPTEIVAIDAFGNPQQRGTSMPETSEQLLPGVNSNFWFEREDFDSGWTPIHYRLRFQAPGTYPVRIKLVSKSMYRSLEEDHTIHVIGARG